MPSEYLCAARSRCIQKAFWEGVCPLCSFFLTHTRLLYVVYTLGICVVWIPLHFGLSILHSSYASSLLKHHGLIDYVSVLLDLYLFKINSSGTCVSVSRCLHFNIGFILEIISRCSVSAHRKYNPYRLMSSCSSTASLEIIINTSCCQVYLPYDPLHLLFQNRSHCQWMFCCLLVYLHQNSYSTVHVSARLNSDISKLQRFDVMFVHLSIFKTKIQEGFAAVYIEKHIPLGTELDTKYGLNLRMRRQAVRLAKSMLNLSVPLCK
jgi:hypothetical protein